MKKLFTLFAGLCLAISALAQKDLEMKLLSPPNGASLYVNKTIPLTYSIKNVGTLPLAAEDSFFVSIKWNGSYIMGQFNNTHVAHSTLLPGDSVFYTIAFGFTQVETTPFSFCMELRTSKNGVRVDNNIANNEGCAMLTVRANTTSTSNVPQTAISVYPNPASGNYLTIDAVNAKVTKAGITDLTGREIITHLLENGNTQIPLEGLQNGMYVCRLYGENGSVASVRFSVVK